MCVCVCVCDSRLPRKLLVCALPSGKRSAGGQKCRWNDLLARDLKRVGLGEDWRSSALDRRGWRRTIVERLEEVNNTDEVLEKQRKDDRRRRREGRQMASEVALHCGRPGCSFVALTSAGLANHTHQKHQQPQSSQCPHCHRTFKQQGLANHQRFCATRQH